MTSTCTRYAIFYSLFVISFSQSHIEKVWTYSGSNGPRYWYMKYPKCGGRSQSPIDIITDNVELDTSLSAFCLNGYHRDKRRKLIVTNNGHTVKIDLEGQNITMSGGKLPGTYLASQLHFHWGPTDFTGSEHCINGRRFPMEIHIVHYSKLYNTIEDAINKTAGLAVLAVFFQVGDHNDAFDELLAHFDDISNRDEHTTLSFFSLESFLPQNTDIYYRYYGSLTTPPCYESIIWTVFKMPVEISKSQLSRVRENLHQNYKGFNEAIIAEDFRPLQELNNRHVYASDQSALSTSEADILQMPYLLLTVQLFLNVNLG